MIRYSLFQPGLKLWQVEVFFSIQLAAFQASGGAEHRRPKPDTQKEE
jgi:hypothetical protein